MSASNVSPASCVIVGATIIDGVASGPVEGRCIWIEAGRIKAIARRDELQHPQHIPMIDVRGKYVIPGLMDANVHLLLDMRLENLVRYEDRYEGLIVEAAQVALRNGVTTVFDTWGPRKPLMSVRDKIASGQILGSRIFCAGNIIGLGGPLSEDFLHKSAEVASSVLVERINSAWAENVGPALTWMAPEQVAQEVRGYIDKGIDFIKYASSEHRIPIGSSAFLAFSPLCQSMIVEEAHRAGLTAQAHIQSVEALRVSVEAGCDIIQHCNITGPVAIPDTTLRLLVDRKTASTVFPITQRRSEWLKTNGDMLTKRLFTPATVEENVSNLVRSGATLLLATDSGLLASETATDPALGAVYSGNDNLFELGEGHFHWFTAMEEKGLPPMEALKAATRNTAVAYKRDRDLGSIEPGKIADLVILDKDPLRSASHYRSIHMILKDGVIVDRSSLPLAQLLTGGRQPDHGAGGLPCCCARF